MERYIVLDLEDFATRDNLEYVLNKHVELGYQIAHIVQGHSSGTFPERFIREAVIVLEKMPAQVPEGLEHIRELDLEIHELISAGLIERKDCGYALTEQ